MFIKSSSFTKSLATKCMYLNNEPYITRPFLVDLNLVELKYYPFMINLDKCNGSCNVDDDLSAKMCVLNKPKSINAKVYNMITKINEFKTLIKNISSDCR